MSMLQVKLAALLLLASKMVIGSPCTFALKGLAAFCEGGSIRKIPQDLPNNITILDLRRSLIKTINIRDLDRYRQLEAVVFSSNPIETVDVKAFAHLTQLLAVSLINNRLTHIDNTIFINNTNLIYVELNGNKLFFDPVIPFLISSSIETLKLQRCNIRQITNATFSKMEKLKHLFISENNILRLDAASFKYNLLQILHIDFAEQITPTLTELICKNVNVTCTNDVHNFCHGKSTKELKCNLTTPKTSTNSPPKEIYSVSASPEENVTTEERAESTTEMKNSPPKEIYSVSASPEVNVTIQGRAESTTEMRLDAGSFKHNSLQELEIDFTKEITHTLTELICKNVNVLCNNDLHNFCQGNSTNELKCNLTIPKITTEMTTQTNAKDHALVYVFSSLALISTGLSVTVLVLYLKNRKSKTNGSKPETSSSPEYKFTLVENYEVNDGYEVARNNDLHLVQMQPDVLPVWPTVKAPRSPLPLPSLPVTRGSINSYHVYEEIRDQ